MRWYGVILIIFMSFSGCNYDQETFNQRFLFLSFPIESIRFADYITNNLPVSNSIANYNHSGILMKCISTNAIFIESGITVRYKTNARNKDCLDLLISNTIYQNYPSDYVSTMNYRELIAWIHAGLWETAIIKEYNESLTDYRKRIPVNYFHDKKIEDLFHLAMHCLYSNTNYIFRENYIYELVGLAKLADYIKSDGKAGYPSVRLLCSLYLTDYPDGKCADEIELIYFYYKNWNYEYEGFARDVYQLILQYSNYLEEHKDKPIADSIKMEIARRYIYISHCHSDINDKPMSLERRTYFIRIILDILNELQDSKDSMIRKEVEKKMLYYEKYQNFF